MGVKVEVGVGGIDVWLSRLKFLFEMKLHQLNQSITEIKKSE